MRCRDPWVTGWAAAVGLALICVGLFMQLHIAKTQVAEVSPDPYAPGQIQPQQYEMAYRLLERSFDSVVHELDSIRATCPPVEVTP